MNQRPQKVLLLGSGALKIGEAGEFDYSGSQAIKALKEEGIATVLVNPNIATIQTSEGLADQVYFLPVTAPFVEQVIEHERPDAIMVGFGGQTALNCGLALARSGVLDRYGVAVLGTPIKAIEETEDRDLFARSLHGIGVKVPRSAVATTVEEGLKVASEVGYPVMLRVAYALGGLGSGLCANAEQLRDRAAKAFAHSHQVLIEEYLTGWKEIEYEVVRDRFDNCVTVCNMENLDPMGVHTGESIVVAPSQTLTNREYHELRRIATTVVRHLGIVGECNIQFAVDPHSDDYRVIEVNARLSRSSALASKATGYPLALIAAKLGLGYSLTELPNAITGVTMACFEPALDYIVVKVPRWDLQKFRHVSHEIGSGMKSVGEVMAIGRTFEEALQKALRMLEPGRVQGLVGNDRFADADLEGVLRNPTPERVFIVAEAMKQGYSVEEIHGLTHIDRWFLYKIRHVVDTSEALRRASWPCSRALLIEAKRAGFADDQIARLFNISGRAVARYREEFGIRPVVKQIDTLAAEYPAQTNYLYLTYNGESDDVPGGEHQDSVIVLGSGAYRIGSSVEFDWCCMNAVRTLRRLQYKTIVINHNPETVSTDYNESDKLYFDELSLETILEIYRREKPIGLILAVGGQVPNNLALSLQQAGVRVLGTSPTSIDAAENRQTFSRLLDQLHIEQPLWKELVTVEESVGFANAVGYPVLVRPSYVLSGAAMSVASTDAELTRFLQRATSLSPEHPVVISKFMEDARELEMDALARDGRVIVSAISEHVENAGVHSGDATLVLPPQQTCVETKRQITKMTARIARALNINGPFNIQFIVKGKDVRVIECNLRASRSMPFVAKILDVNMIDLATRVMMGERVAKNHVSARDVPYVGVKAPQFSFTRLDGADPTLGVEMASTGEVGCLGDDFEEAFLKALLAVGYRLPLRGVLLSTGTLEMKATFIEHARMLASLDTTLYATPGTAAFLQAAGIATTVLCPSPDGCSQQILDSLRTGRIDLVINIPKSTNETELTKEYRIRRAAVDFGVPLMTNLQLAQRFVEALSSRRLEDLKISSWSDYMGRSGSRASSAIDALRRDVPAPGGENIELRP